MDERERYAAQLEACARTADFVAGDAKITPNAARRIAALLRAQQPACPEGWRMVPTEPTPEMVRAVVPMYDAMLPDTEWPFTINVYRKMLAVAPEAPSLPAPSPAPMWRPIETAPKDGAWILGWAASDSSPYRISWGINHRGHLSWNTSFATFTDGYITHWQPLPAPPAGA
jgi:hypothetical protein